MGIIKDVSKYLTEDPAIKLKIIGYTDSDGQADANQQLSAKRAAAVKKVLINEFKIEASRLEALGKGETVPINDNKTESNKALNRRVEFVKG